MILNSNASAMPSTHASASSPQAAPPSTADDLIKDGTVDNFMTDVVEASLKTLVVVDFWSQRSPLCKQLITLLEKEVLALKGAVRLVKVDIDKNPEIAQQFRVQTVPTVYAMFQGQPVDGFRGSQTEPQLKQWLQKIVKATAAMGGAPDPMAEITAALQGAEEMLIAGDWQTAQDIYADILGIAPDSATAYAGVIRSMIAGGHLDHARTMLADAPEAFAKDKALATARTALELADAAVAAGPVQELEQKLAANEADPQARFDLALALVAANRREEAVDHLLDIVRRQRSWNEEAARKQLVKLFEAFGNADPVTVSGRKRLSSLLFA